MSVAECDPASLAINTPVYNNNKLPFDQDTGIQTIPFGGPIYDPMTCNVPDVDVDVTSSAGTQVLTCLAQYSGYACDASTGELAFVSTDGY